jgi:thiamine biosynthesis lipoprotein
MRWIWRFCLLAALAAACSSCVSTQGDIITLYRFEVDQTEMGVPFRIVLYDPNQNVATNAAAAAYKRIQQLNDKMTDYDADSELSRLSRTSGQGKPVKVTHDLWVVLQRAQTLAEQSGGAFDMTVGPYVNLWRTARRTGKTPDPARLAKARRSVGYRLVKLDPARQTVELLGPDMRLDLGGIAKGYAVDQAMHVLTAFGVGDALVSGGGDIAVSGPPPGKRGWRIELPPLDTSNAPPAKFVVLTHAGLSTSGDLFQRLDANGRRYSHIIDPRTGIGLTDHSLVTVIAPNDFTADSLTKVMSVLPPAEALRFLQGQPHAAVRIVRQPGRRIEQYESQFFHRYYE